MNEYNKKALTYEERESVLRRCAVPMGQSRDQTRWRPGFMCHYCCYTLDRREAQVEHILSRRRGGTNAPENLVVACRPCNVSKGNKIYFEYVGSLG